MWTLGAMGGVPGRYTACKLQGNGQRTHPIPTQYIPSTFRMFPVNLIAVFPVQEVPSTFTVFYVM